MQYVALSREVHGTQHWLRPVSYTFAAGEAMAPIVAGEAPKAAVSLPLAFIAEADGFFPAAVLGLAPGKNFFVAPDGRWLGSYIPAALRFYPFRLANTPDGERALAIDAASGLLTEGPIGDPLFNEDGSLAPSVSHVMEFLRQIEASRLQTVSACAALNALGLIVPWMITVGQANAGTQRVEGLHRVDEEALNALSGEDFAGLRLSGALLLAYCQLLSMQHMPVLGQLAQLHANAAATKAPAELDLSFLNSDQTIKFGNLG